MKTNLVLSLMLFVALQLSATNLPVNSELEYFAAPTGLTLTTKVEKATKMLTGKWVNTSIFSNGKKSKRSTRTYLKYQFKKDGTYVKLMGNKSAEVLERGFWRISDDGAYILFYVSEDGTAQKINATQFAKITKLNNNTMKIAFALDLPVCNDKANTSYREFSFDRK